MEKTPSELKYTQSHEWAKLEDDGTVIIGITDHAQSLLGDMVYVELPEIDVAVKTGDECGVVESVKAASDLFSPISGDIIEINEALNDDPSLMNTDPYGDGWILRLQPNDESELNELMSSDEYEELVESEE